MSERKMTVTTVKTKQVTFALTGDELIAMLQDYKILPTAVDIGIKVRTYMGGDSEPDVITFDWETATTDQEEIPLPTPVSPPADIQPGARARVNQMLRRHAKRKWRDLWVCPVCNVGWEHIPTIKTAPKCPADPSHGLMDWAPGPKVKP